MMLNNKNTVVAVYTQHYLTISMTFIYRQLRGISEWFKPIVLASRTENLDLFPFDPIYVIGKVSFPERVYYKLYRMVSGRASVLPRSQLNYWKDIHKKHDIRLIHAHFGPSGLDMLPIAKKLKIPLLVTFRGYDASSLLRNEDYLASLRDLFNYAYIITVSKTMADRLIAIGADPSRIEAHYNGIPVNDFRYTERIPICEKVRRGETLELLQVSGFVEMKGHKYTIMAFRDFLSIYPNSRLTLAGDGGFLRPSMEKLCADLGIQDKVRFTGRVTPKEVIPLMTQSDVFLHHSITAEDGNQEGIPNVLMEAMATGLPVVSTYHSGIPELVRDGVDGHLVRERAVNDYVKKLKMLLEDGSDYGRNGAERVRSYFNIDYQNRKLAAIYDKILGN